MATFLPANLQSIMELVGTLSQHYGIRNVMCVLYVYVLPMPYSNFYYLVLHMQVDAGSQFLLSNVERFGLYVANSEDNTSTILSRPNIGMCFAYMYVECCYSETIKKTTMSS